MMIPEFDAIANNYDFDFTDSLIGRLQRNQVYHFLDPILKTLKGNKVLDLGCGTGEDAIWFAEKNCSVTAIDYSSEMIRVANQKTEAKNLQSNIKYYTLSITHLEQLPTDLKFDLIFSNFGALNCIDPNDYNTLTKSIFDRLHSHGHLVIVVLNKFCLWESIYFLYKRKFRKIFRRMGTSGIMAPLTQDVQVKTWYLHPQEFTDLFNSNFNKVAVSPIGFFVPPSYLTWFAKPTNAKWLSLFYTLDRLNPFRYISSYAGDHFIIHMIRK